MPLARVNGIGLHYEDVGSGDPVVMIMGTGARGAVWNMYQVPALKAAGYRVITLDNRGVAATEWDGSPFTVADLAADVAALAERLALGPVRVVGTSMGAWVAQELALTRPELVRQAVLIASRGRCDALRSMLARAELELLDSDVRLPDRYRAVLTALHSLSPRTTADDAQVADWIDLFELSPGEGPGVRAQLALEPMPDRLAAYAGIRVPCHVISFADDLTTPPEHGRELAGAIPGATFQLVEHAGHFGYLERPEEVNKSIIDFFAAR